MYIDSGAVCHDFPDHKHNGSLLGGVFPCPETYTGGCAQFYCDACLRRGDGCAGYNRLPITGSGATAYGACQLLGKLFADTAVAAPGWNTGSYPIEMKAGGIVFEGVTIEDRSDRPWLRVLNESSASGASPH